MSPPAKKAAPHARATGSKAKKPKPTGHGAVVEARIAHIETMMLSWTFVTGKTAKGLAKQWNLSLDTVAVYTAEASKRAKKSLLENKDEINREICAALRIGIEIDIKRKATGNLARLGEAWAKIADSMPASRTEVTGADGAALAVVNVAPTPAMAARLVREAFGAQAVRKDGSPVDHVGSAGAAAAEPPQRSAPSTIPASPSAK